MSEIPAIIKVPVRLSQESEPTSLEVGGTYNPDTGDFTYHQLGRGGQEKVIHNAGGMLVQDKPAQPSEPTA